MTNPLTFETFSRINRERCREWMGESDTLHHHALGLAGETGELCNVIKKLDRLEHGKVGGGKGPFALREQAKEEIADVLIYLDLVAMHFGVTLDDVVIKKFNATSKKYGFKQHLQGDNNAR